MVRQLDYGWNLALAWGREGGTWTPLVSTFRTPYKYIPEHTMLPKEQMRVLLAISVGLGASLGSLSWLIVNHGSDLLLIASVSAIMVFSLMGTRVIQKAPKTATERATC